MPRYADDMSDAEIRRRIEEEHDLQRRETEDFFIREVREGYPERQRSHWNRNYASVTDYLESVESNRQEWRETLGTFGDGPNSFEPTVEPFLRTEAGAVHRHDIALFDEYRLRGRALLGVPASGSEPYPLVVCQHGAGSAPERIFGYDDPKNQYHGFGRDLLEAGFAVLAPRALNGDGSRDKSETLAQSIGKSVFGLEAHRISRFLDYLVTDERFDDSRIGMWGLSMGGTSTLFVPPLERRIQAAVCSGFFNRRLKINVLDDPRFGNFWPASSNVHFSVPGWLHAFTDADLVSLICPRSFMAQVGKADAIGWIPDIEREFADARAHYERLDIDERIELCLHEGGHEVAVDEGVRFLREQL